jgi:asparagine synthase (glutamine-hydrolysing)
MITQYTQSQLNLVLESDLAGEFPLYLYWPQHQSTLLYSTSITELLNDERLPKPLKINNEGISFLLQSGVVAPPKTAYQDIYIVGIGDKAQVSTQNGKVDVVFSHRFPFINANRLAKNEMQPDEDLILQMLAEATISRIDKSNPSFLFHSAGKDSNSIALALAEAGWQDKVTLITHKSKGRADESEISAKIAKQLGFKHQILHEVDQLQSDHHQAIEDYFINAPFPCADNVTIAYPLYAHQAPELSTSNLIFGDGNDSHMISPPDKRQCMVLPYSKIVSNLSFIRCFINSESKLNPIMRTPAEWFGASGLSFKDCLDIYPDSLSVYHYWAEESRIRNDWDIFDFKSDIYSTRTITERMIRKLFNFADVIDSKVILPFANQKVAEYFAKMPECYLFGRKTLKNKLILRKILKERINLDSDAVGKMGWSYDSRSVVLKNWDNINQEISACLLWNLPGLLKVTSRMKNRMNGTGWGAAAAGRFLYRLYLISAWYNHNKFIN